MAETNINASNIKQEGNTPASNALATQLLRIVFSVYLAIAVTVTLVHIAAEYLNVEESIYQELTQINVTFEKGLAQALWDMNDEYAQSIPLGILNMPVVTGVQLQDIAGNIISDVGEGTKKEDLLQRSFDISFMDLNEEKKVGTLILSSSRTIILEKVRYGFLFILINSVIKSAALWIIFLWFGKRLVSTPLASLTSQVKKLDFDNLDSTTIPKPVKRENEISTLTDSFNQLIDKLTASKSELNEIHQQLKFEIKEHKEANQEIEHLNQALEERVSLRTKELQQAKQEAEHSDQAKTQFLSRMSHELRTPLNEVLGFAQIQEKAYKKDSDSRQKESTQHILSAGNKLLRLVDDLLSYSQMDNQDDDIALECCDIDIAIREAIHEANELIPNSQIQINYTASQLKAKSNLLKLVEIIVHLITNGIKYNHPKGSVNIISAISAEGNIEIAIQDSGVGVDKAYFKEIFLPFKRLEYAELNQIGGIGVGLSLARKLARKMKGDITLAHSSPDGSLFIITLLRSSDLGLSAQL